MLLKMDSSSRSEEQRVEKLDGTNFNSWKFNMKLLLMEKDLYGFLDGSEVAPVPTDNNKMEKEIKLFKSRSQKAFSMIALAISKQLQVHIRSTVDPKVAWDTLKAQFEFISTT